MLWGSYIPLTFPHQTVTQIKVIEEVVSPKVSKLKLNNKQKAKSWNTTFSRERLQKKENGLITWDSKIYITPVGGSILQKIFDLSQNACFAMEKKHD